MDSICRNGADRKNIGMCGHCLATVGFELSQTGAVPDADTVGSSVPLSYFSALFSLGILIESGKQGAVIAITWMLDVRGRSLHEMLEAYWASFRPCSWILQSSGMVLFTAPFLGVIEKLEYRLWHIVWILFQFPVLGLRKTARYKGFEADELDT